MATIDYSNTMPSGAVKPEECPPAFVQLIPAHHVLSESDYIACYRLLGAAERDRLVRLAPRKQREFLIGRVLLRYLLSHAVQQCVKPNEWCIEERPDMPPRVVQAETEGLRFSISHSAGAVAVAVSAHVDLGVDIEYRRPRDFLALAQMAFHPAERERLEQCSDEALCERFYRLWTLSEASLKSQLLGINSGMISRLRIGDGGVDEYGAKKLTGLAAEFGAWNLALVSLRPVTVTFLESAPLLGARGLNCNDIAWEQVSVFMPNDPKR